MPRASPYKICLSRCEISLLQREANSAKNGCSRKTDFCCRRMLVESNRTRSPQLLRRNNFHRKRIVHYLVGIPARGRPVTTIFCWTVVKLRQCGSGIRDNAPLTTWPCHSYCCDRKSRAACAQSFALWQQATIEFTCRDHSIIACSRHAYLWCCSSRTSRSWWITHLTQHHRRGCNSTHFFVLSQYICMRWKSRCHRLDDQ